MRIYVTTEGLDKLQNQIIEMVRRGRNLQAPLGKAGQIMLYAVDQNFAAEGRPKWPPRSRLTRMIMDYSAMERAAGSGRYGGQTRRWKTKAGILRRAVEVSRGNKLLQVSGDLRKSIHMDIKNGELVVGTALKYARIHQLGGEIRPKKGKALWIPIRSGRYLLVKKVRIPARPFLALQPGDNQKIVRIFEDWLAGD